jgi:1,4-alpha-glucan branching enzyme
MGNEFGHPEWIDFPRQGNNWSYHYARRQWSLVDHPDLKYKFLGAFDHAMIHLMSEEKILEDKWPRLINANNGDHVLFFERGLLVFAFNFNPTRSFTDYGFGVEPGKYKIVLNSDALEFGGHGLVDTSILYYSFPDYATAPRHMMKIYLPARTVLVFKRFLSKKIY